jgi:hypothetical protein
METDNSKYNAVQHLEKIYNSSNEENLEKASLASHYNFPRRTTVGAITNELRYNELIIYITVN